MVRNQVRGRCAAAFLAAVALIAIQFVARPALAATCRKVTLSGEVNAGQEWKAQFGQGWVFRVIPIEPGKAGYSGWDLVVDRETPAGFPDALLLATPPWNSINEHEVGTTFGLRAQDAIGWNPRSFRFLTDPAAFRESQRLFAQINQTGTGSQKEAGTRAEKRLMEWGRKSAAGQFRILNARLTPGLSDAAAYAENWARASARTPHSLEPAADGKSTELGQLRWMRFTVTLWLPAGWVLPRDVQAVPATCSE